MAAALKTQRGDDAEQGRRNTRNTLIAQRVIHALGEPCNLLQVQVRQLWDQRYRVNVFVGSDTISARVANSYFLQTDDEGNIIASTPKIRRQYERPAEAPSPLPSTGAA
jgi:hypothetical protein